MRPPQHGWGLKDPTNQLITFDYRKNPMRIIGVVERNAIVGSTPFYRSQALHFKYTIRAGQEPLCGTG